MSPRYQSGWRCRNCDLPFNNGPDFGRFTGWCWPCVRRVKGLTGGKRKR